MKKSLVLSLVAIAAMTAFTGCGSATETKDEAVATKAPEASKAPEADKEESTEDTSTEAKTTMNFINGEKELPTKFDNFVIMDYTLVDQFVALGVPPKYGSVGEKPKGEMTDYYNDWERAFDDFDLTSITRVNQRSDTFMEELVSYKPDFIVIAEGSMKMLEKYEAIAPTYVIPDNFEIPADSSLWKEELKFVGEFLGKSELANEKIASYDKLVEESREKVKAEIEGKTALVLQLNQKGFKIRMPETQASIYADLGFGVPEGLTSEFASTSVSNEDGSFPVEQIVEFNPDYIFIQTQDDEGYLSLVGTPIWDNIEAVKNGRVYEITQSAWNHLNGYHANKLRMEDLVYFITEDKQLAIGTPIS